MKNGNDPTPGNITEEKESELEEFIDYARLVLGALGHKVFSPNNPKAERAPAQEEPVEQPGPELYLKRAIKKYGITVTATGRQTSDGFVVLRGSVIAPEDNHTVSPGAKKRRQAARVDEHHVLQEDELFSTPSGAAVFMIGSSANGWNEWRTADGRTLHDLESKS